MPKPTKKLSSQEQAQQSDPVCLNFHDIILRTKDINILKGPHWLNDQIIAFYFAYLKKLKYKNNSEVLFVAPAVTQCMKFISQEELTTMLNDLNAGSKMFILFALNDNITAHAGGSHWSLLALSRPERTFYHFDSFCDQNGGAASQLMHQVKAAMNYKRFRLKPMKCLQQTNTYDCGIHLLCMAEKIVDYVNIFKCIDGVGQLKQETVDGKRAKLLKLIVTLGGKHVSV
ncbi:sentrin-specific protease 8-like [Teleopsis dalmanni]|uniref:sentrin-specific protease 8-like n=1 Tax=Teleopsis dalmanni TaxID=139649 RepID=UPI0018CE6A56|nr:sentrin-specific protease 8-like [Teleopsis dalmanni]